MTERHSPLFTLESGQSGLGIYTSGRDAALGREINRYVHERLDQLQIGSIQNSNSESFWGFQPLQGQPLQREPINPIVLQPNPEQGGTVVDLIGTTCTRISGTDDLQPGLGGIDSDPLASEQPNEMIFRSHRNS